tara:strand:- start:78 stop:776 length:699 start_codon:yes stop_codon:yes gene_type:complete
MTFLSKYAQTTNKEKNFGFESGAIIPINYFGAGPLKLSENNSELTLSSKVGYHFGMVIKTNYGKRFCIENGINFLRRNFIIHGSSKFNGSYTSDTSKFGYISYGIPIRGSVFIQLDKEIFMSTSVGASLDFYASAVGSKGINYNIDHISDRARWINGSISAEIGVELRSEVNGTFHVGIGVNIPISTIAVTKLKYFYNINDYDRYENEFLKGNFFNINLRYYLPKYLEEKKS